MTFDDEQTPEQVAEYNLIMSCVKDDQSKDKPKKSKKAKKDKNKGVKMENVAEFLNSKGVFFDALRKNFFITKDKKTMELSDNQINGLYIDALKEDHTVSIKDFYLILNSDRITTIAPLKSYFDNLPSWNGTEAIKALSDTIFLKDVAEHSHFYEMLKKWLVGAVACSISDNINGLCLIFLGDQGAGKSTWFRHLAPPDLKDYYTEHNPRNDKDSLVTICSNFIVNIDELGAFHKSDITYLKGLITQKTHDIRLPYGKTNTKIKRQSSFCGSGNQSAFLSDLTGNRRFLVFDIQGIDLTALQKVNISDVWSEALHLYKAGFRYWLDQDEVKEINARNEMFMIQSIEEEKLLERFKNPYNELPYDMLTTTEIAEKIGLPTNQTTLRKIGEVLSKHGFIKKSVRRKDCDIPKYCYCVKDNSATIF